MNHIIFCFYSKLNMKKINHVMGYVFFFYRKNMKISNNYYIWVESLLCVINFEFLNKSRNKGDFHVKKKKT